MRFSNILATLLLLGLTTSACCYSGHMGNTLGEPFKPFASANCKRAAGHRVQLIHLLHTFVPYLCKNIDIDAKCFAGRKTLSSARGSLGRSLLEVDISAAQSSAMSTFVITVSHCHDISSVYFN